MATSFPSSLDSFTNPLSSDTLSSPSHSAQHADANDAIEALQAKVGADSSAVTSSHDYKIADHASRITTLEAISHGKILQVVEGSTTTQVVTSSASYVIVGASATITPTSASSTIWVVSFLTGIRMNGTSSEAIVGVHRGDPTAGGILLTEAQLWDANSSDRRLSQTVVSMDSPATTSAVTYYQTGFKASGAGTAFYTQYNVTTRKSTIVVFEVGS